MDHSRGIKHSHRLNADQVFDILSFLPTKSLRRFQCVSREWAARISQRRSLLPMCALAITISKGRREEIQEIVLAPPARTDTKDAAAALHCFMSRLHDLPCTATENLIHASNGLFLFEDDKTQIDFWVCNLATMECVSLPKCGLRIHCFTFLAYDPRESPHFKVLRLKPLIFDNKGICFEIYSSKTGKWAEGFLHLVVPYKTGYISGASYLNGALYFHDFCTIHLFELNVETMDCRVITLPTKHSKVNIDYTSIYSLCLGVSRGHLHLAEINFSRRHLNIWKLVIEGEVTRWILLHRMSTKAFKRHLRISVPEDKILQREVVPIAFHPDSDVLYLRIRQELFSYHPDTEMLDELYTLPETRIPISWTNTFTGIISLESIHPPGSTIFRW